jgi:VanZ family protein
MMKLYFIKRVWIILLIFWAGMLFSIGLIPDPDEIIKQSVSKFRWDYLEHFTGYFMLGLFFVLWRGDRTFRIRAMDTLLFIVFGGIFSWLAEYIQVFIPGRSFSMYDILYNFLGMITGAGLGYFLLVRVVIRKTFKTA